jgi:hypothetical protein
MRLKPKDFQAAYKRMQNNPDFYLFLEVINSERDGTIQQLEDAPTDQLQQKAGAILTYDRILKDCQFDDMRQRFGPMFAQVTSQDDEEEMRKAVKKSAMKVAKKKTARKKPVVK